MATALIASDPVSRDATKSRLIEAAGVEFAAHGFDGATIRAISKRAGANLAAVNYHFRDKEQLYLQAVIEAHRCGVDDPGDVAMPTAPARERLRSFVSHFLTRVLALGRKRSWHDDLILREMLRPTQACAALVETVIRPRFERLRGIMQELAPGSDERRLHALCFSVIGQCLFYRTARSITTRLIGKHALEGLDLDYLTEHVTRVALAAVEDSGPACGSESRGARRSHERGSASRGERP